MMTPSELFNNVNEVVEVVEESIEDKQVLEEDISHSVSLIDGAFRNIQEQILNSNRKELSPYKDQVIEVYNLCKDIKENQLPRYKKEVLQSDLRTESRITELKKELYETLEQRITETEETIKVYFREEIKGVNKLRASVLAVEEYIGKNQKTILELRKDVFAELRRKDVTSETTQNIINKKLDEIGKEYETLSESLLSDPPSTDNPDPITPLDQDFVTLDQLKDHYRLFVNRVQQQLYSIGGGGETRLEFLDDIDRDTALIDGRVLKYDSSGLTNVENSDTYFDWSWQTNTSEQIDALKGFAFNTSNSNYSATQWQDPNPGSTKFSIRYHSNNTIDLFDESNSEVIATKDTNGDGNPIYISWVAGGATNNQDQMVDDFFGGGDVGIALTTTAV